MITMNKTRTVGRTLSDRWLLRRSGWVFNAGPESPSIIPLPAKAQLWIDFDGTITQQDVLDELIRQYALDDSWKTAEALWQAGAIGSHECLTRQLAVVRFPNADLENFLDSIELDPGFNDLIELLELNHVPVAVLSDGLDFIIGPLLARAGFGNVHYRSNTALRTSEMLRLRCPHSSGSCESASAHCKCKSIHEWGTYGREAIYVGDGRSDLCPARKAKCRFAKGVLADNLGREGYEFLTYSDLSEVTSALTIAWS